MKRCVLFKYGLIYDSLPSLRSPILIGIIIKRSETEYEPDGNKTVCGKIWYDLTAIYLKSDIGRNLPKTLTSFAILFSPFKVNFWKKYLNGVVSWRILIFFNLKVKIWWIFVNVLNFHLLYDSKKFLRGWFTFCDDKDFESFFAVILPLKCLSFTKQKNDTLIYALLSF